MLPDGNQAVSFTPSGWVAGTLTQPSSLVPLALRVDLRAPFHANAPGFYSRIWTANDAPGDYVYVLAAIRPGALADNRFDPGDIVALSSVRVTFTP